MRLAKFIIPVFLIAVFATACDETRPPTTPQAQRQQSIETRAQVFSRAQSAAPVPNPQNFPLRKALVEFTNREDQINHPWYVYILGDPGNVIGYYVAKSVPVNSCAFLSSTEDFVEHDHGSYGSNSAVLTAPSLDGIYYGGSGAAGGCDEWFFFDQTSDALIKIRGVKFFLADQPLRLKADPILVEGSK